MLPSTLFNIISIAIKAKDDCFALCRI